MPPPGLGPGLGPEGFAKGEKVSAHLVGPLEWQPGLFVAIEGSYWQGPAEVAGRVISYIQEGENREIVGRFVEPLLNVSFVGPVVKLSPTSVFTFAQQDALERR